MYGYDCGYHKSITALILTYTNTPVFFANQYPHWRNSGCWNSDCMRGVFSARDGKITTEAIFRPRNATWRFKP